MAIVPSKNQYKLRYLCGDQWILLMVLLFCKLVYIGYPCKAHGTNVTLTRM